MKILMKTIIRICFFLLFLNYSNYSFSQTVSYGGGEIRNTSFMDLRADYDNNGVGNEHIRFFTGNGSIPVASFISGNGHLQFPNTLNNRKITLYDYYNNAYQFYGFGIGTNILKYQLENTNASHVFYAGLTSSTEKELVRITGSGIVQFPGTDSYRKLVLYDNLYNDFQYVGMGFHTGKLMFNVEGNSNDYVFNVGTSSTARAEIFRIKGNGNVGIGTASPNVPLQFANSYSNRKIVLYQGANNDHQVFGIGANSAANYNFMRYQVTSTGDRHVFLAGSGTTSSVELMSILGNGTIQAGGTFQLGSVAVPSGYKMAVDGKVICTELKVKASGTWPDYVFSENYKLMPLDSVASYINENKHLPEVPSAKEIEANGINTGEMNALLLKKLEELTLYMIDQKKEIESLKGQVEELKKK